jgi:hypothetical protein
MSSQIVPPGRDLIEVARALEFFGRSAGRFPYQWSRPGPNSKPVIVNGILMVTGETDETSTIVTYSVPDGMIFSLTGFITGFAGTGWNEGSGDLLFTLNVQGGVGNRPVDYLRDISVSMGDFKQGPFPIPARLEFQPGNVLAWTLFEVGSAAGGPVTGSGQNALVQIYGHLYPIAERV